MVKTYIARALLKSLKSRERDEDNPLLFSSSPFSRFKSVSAAPSVLRMWKWKVLVLRGRLMLCMFDSNGDIDIASVCTHIA
jgi:hypothetical protein